MPQSSLDLTGKVPALLLENLQRVHRVAKKEHIPFILIGAAARDLILEIAYGLPAATATRDIDIAIRVESWTEFEKLKHALSRSETQPSDRVPHRIHLTQDLILDLIPFGDIEKPQGSIAWPPKREIVMTTLGFQEAYNHAILVTIAPETIIPTLSPAGLFLLKIIAWDENPTRSHDAEDLEMVLMHYLDLGNFDRFFAEHTDLISEEYDVLLGGAALLGRDLHRMLSTKARTRVISILEKKIDPSLPRSLAIAMVRVSPDYSEVVEQRVSLLGRVLSELRNA
jgi:predicted nucleotidyltransferase